MKRIVIATALTALHCLAWSEPNAHKKPPTQAEINKVVQSMLLCGLDGSVLGAQDKPLHNRVLNHLDQQENIAIQRNGQVTLKFNVLNAEFQQFFMSAGINEAVFGAWSPKVKLDTLLAQLQRLGHKAVPAVMKEVAGPVWQVERITPDDRATLQLFPGRLEHRENAQRQQGVSLMCTRGRVPDDVSLARTGIPSTSTIRQLVAGKAQQPAEWVYRIIASGYTLPQVAISEYRWLQPGQVDTLLALKQPLVDATLAENEAVTLSPEQLNTLLSRAQVGTLHMLARYRFSQLSVAQQEALSRHPDVAEKVVFKKGGQPALRLLEAKVKASDLQEVQTAFAQMTPITPEAIDMVVAHGSKAIKAWMTMEQKLDYTPAQIDALLRDPSAEVQIGVLRRKEVPITRAQYDQGVNHPDPNLAFWYSMREEFVPSAQQIEKGLNSPDEATRRGWVLGTRYRLSDSQSNRVWQDPALRGALLSRADFVLSPAQTDECTIDPNPTVRMACVQRTDYELTHQRFEQMLLDTNPNVLGDFLQRKEPRVNLAPFVEHAMQNGNNLALMVIARNAKVPVSEADVQRAQSNANAAVRVAFCKRQPQVCTDQNDHDQQQSETEHQFRNNIIRRSEQAFRDEDFAALQEQAMRISQTEPHTPSGVSAMRYFYEGLDSAKSQMLGNNAPEAGLVELKAKLSKWTAQYPGASTPVILQAMAYLDAATMARKNKAKDGKSEETYLNAAHFHLSRHKSLAALDPQWYMTMLLVAQRQQWSADRMEQLVAEVHEMAPSFLPFHFSMVHYNSPKWCGSLQDLEAYILRAMKSNEPREGKSYYARLYWYASEVEFGDNLFTDSLVQWPLMRQGFEDLVARYPVAWNINHFARFACMAGDKETTRKLLQRIKGELIPWAWSSGVSIGYCERLANAP